MSTTFPRKEDIERKWYLVDAADLSIGRVSTFVARILMGKNKPQYTPHLDMGDHVVVINADKVVFSGRKVEFKVYRRHSGRPGNLKEVSVPTLMSKRPTRPVELAVKGMLPKTRLGRAMYRKLHVYAAGEHPHTAQQPEAIEVKL